MTLAEPITTFVAWCLISLALGGIFVVAAQYTKARAYRFEEDSPDSHLTYIKNNLSTWRNMFTISVTLVVASASATIARVTLTDADASTPILATAIWAVFCLGTGITFRNFRSEYSSIQRWNRAKDRLFGRHSS